MLNHIRPFRISSTIPKSHFTATLEEIWQTHLVMRTYKCMAYGLLNLCTSIFVIMLEIEWRKCVINRLEHGNFKLNGAYFFFLLTVNFYVITSAILKCNSQLAPPFLMYDFPFDTVFKQHFRKLLSIVSVI